MTNILDAKMITGFAKEIRSYLPKIREGIDSFGADANQHDALQEALRYVHTIKGAAALVGLSVLSQVTAAIEETLEEVVAGHGPIDAEQHVCLRQTVDHIEHNLDGLLSGTVDAETIGIAVTQLLDRCKGLPEVQDLPAALVSAETEAMQPADCWADAWDEDGVAAGTASDAHTEADEAAGVHTPTPEPPLESVPVPTETSPVSDAFEAEEELVFGVLFDSVEVEIAAAEEEATATMQSEPPREPQPRAEPAVAMPGALDTLIDTIDCEVQHVYGQGVTAPGQRPQADAEIAVERYLLITLAGCHYAVPVPNVIEIGRVPAITPVPNVPVWLCGVINLRGEILSIIDVRTFLGIEEAYPLESSRIVVIKSVRDDIMTSLIVDQVNGFARLPKMRPGPPVASPHDKVTPYIRAVCEHAEQSVAVVDLERLLHSSEVSQFDEA